MDGWDVGTRSSVSGPLFQLTKKISTSLDGLFDLYERGAVGFLALEQVRTAFLAAEISPAFAQGASGNHLDRTGFLSVTLLTWKHKGQVWSCDRTSDATCFLVLEGAV